MAGRPRPRVSRRAFMGGTLAVVAAGCVAAGDETTDGAIASTTRPGQGLPRTLVALFDAPRGVVVSGIPQRLTWAVGNEAGVLLAGQPERLDIEFDVDGQQIGRVEAVRRDVGLDQPFLASSVVFPRFGVATARTMVDGIAVVAEIKVVPPDQNDVPVPGDEMRRVATPTVVDPRGVRPLCSREPPCPFHEITLAEALAGSRPVAFLVAAPGYCESTLCPPALDLLIAAAARAPEVTVVHAEVYVDPDGADSLVVAELTDAVREYGLRFEPSLFLASSAGVVVERLDNIFDADELAAAFAALH